jgi:hypothetical protein
VYLASEILSLIFKFQVVYGEKQLNTLRE